MTGPVVSASDRATRNQLTAGPASLDLDQFAEALERMLRDLAACSCIYVQHTVSAPAPNQPRGARRVRRVEWVIATGFRINPHCPHHGDQRGTTP